MKSIRRRIDRLERETRDEGAMGLTITVRRVDVALALGVDECREILQECGHLRVRPGIRVLNFGRIPPGLNAEELEQYLRERGSEICSPSSSASAAAGK